MDYCILMACWGAFASVHSLLARQKCKDFFKRKMGERFKYYRIAYSLFAIVSLVLVLVWQFSIPDHHFTIYPFVAYWVAIPCGTIALLLMVVCVRKYFYQLSGVAVFFERPVYPILETQGVHKMVRHPLYLGTLLLLWSLFLLSPGATSLIACISISVYVQIGIYLEERKLVLLFGPAYEEYKQSTPMLIPYSAAAFSFFFFRKKVPGDTAAGPLRDGQ